MMLTPVALLPPDEDERLRSLRYYDIVHSLHEPVFDEFAALSARIFSLPISLIALVEANEVYYKGNQGILGQVNQPRVEAVCSMVVREKKAVVFVDLHHDEYLPLTTEARTAAQEKNLHFYAGAPLMMPYQRAIGTLCVIDKRPRTFSADEQQVLEQVARLVAQTIEVRHHCLTGSKYGAERWQYVRAQIEEEIRALVALVRYLIARTGTQIPVPQIVLEPVTRRLNDLHELLDEY